MEQLIQAVLLFIAGLLAGLVACCLWAYGAMGMGDSE